MGGQRQSRSFGKGRDDALAEMAARQHGVVSVRQLRQRLGYSMRMVERGEQAGRLHRLHRGVYAVGHVNLSRHGWCLAAVLASGPGALLSHYSAAWLLGLAKHSPEPFHVTSPQPRRMRPPVRIHYARNLNDRDRELRARIPVTSLPRTLLDLAAIVCPDQLDRMLERAEELKLFNLGPMENVLGRNKGHRGAGRLRRAIAAYRPPVFTRSQLERRLLALIEKAGLPRPATGFNLVGNEVDFYWPELRFVAELDVFETHGTRGAFGRDRLRQEDLLLAGVAMTRIAGERLEREPQQVIERLSRLLELRREELALLDASAAARQPAAGG